MRRLCLLAALAAGSTVLHAQCSSSPLHHLAPVESRRFLPGSRRSGRDQRCGDYSGHTHPELLVVDQRLV